MSKQYESEAPAAVRETALGPHKAGAMNKMTMKMFDEMCLTPTEELTTERIQQIRPPEKRTSVWKV